MSEQSCSILLGKFYVYLLFSDKNVCIFSSFLYAVSQELTYGKKLNHKVMLWCTW